MTRKNRQECLLKWTECALRLLAAALALAAAVAVQPALAHSDSCTGSDRSAIVGTTTCVDDAWLEFWDWCSRNEGERNTDLGKPYCYKPGDLASGCGAFAAISAHSNGTHVYCNNNGATACPSAQTYSPDSHQCQDCPTGQSRGVGSNICVSNGEREFWDWCFGLGGERDRRGGAYGCWRPGNLSTGCGIFGGPTRARPSSANATHIFCTQNGATSCASGQSYSAETGACVCPTAGDVLTEDGTCVPYNRLEFGDWCEDQDDSSFAYFHLPGLISAWECTLTRAPPPDSDGRAAHCAPFRAGNTFGNSMLNGQPAYTFRCYGDNGGTSCAADEGYLAETNACGECAAPTPLVDGGLCVSECSGDNLEESGVCVSACSADNTITHDGECLSECPSGYEESNGGCSYSCPDGQTAILGTEICVADSDLEFRDWCHARDGEILSNGRCRALLSGSTPCGPFTYAGFTPGGVNAGKTECVNNGESACSGFYSTETHSCACSGELFADGNNCVAECPSGEHPVGGSCMALSDAEVTTALHAEIRKDSPNTGAVRSYLKVADADGTLDGVALVIVAATLGHAEVVSVLITAGADPGVRHDGFVNGLNAMHYMAGHQLTTVSRQRKWEVMRHFGDAVDIREAATNTTLFYWDAQYLVQFAGLSPPTMLQRASEVAGDDNVPAVMELMSNYMMRRGGRCWRGSTTQRYHDYCLGDIGRAAVSVLFHQDATEGEAQAAIQTALDAGLLTIANLGDPVRGDIAIAAASYGRGVAMSVILTINRNFAGVGQDANIPQRAAELVLTDPSAGLSVLRHYLGALSVSGETVGDTVWERHRRDQNPRTPLQILDARAKQWINANADGVPFTRGGQTYSAGSPHPDILELQALLFENGAYCRYWGGNPFCYPPEVDIEGEFPLPSSYVGGVLTITARALSGFRPTVISPGVAATLGASGWTLSVDVSPEPDEAALRRTRAFTGSDSAAVFTVTLTAASGDGSRYFRLSVNLDGDYERLVSAVLAGDAEDTALYVNTDVDASPENLDGVPLLMVAATMGFADVVSVLVTAGVDARVSNAGFFDSNVAHMMGARDGTTLTRAQKRVVLRHFGDAVRESGSDFDWNGGNQHNNTPLGLLRDAVGHESGGQLDDIAEMGDYVLSQGGGCPLTGAFSSRYHATCVGTLGAAVVSAVNAGDATAASVLSAAVSATAAGVSLRFVGDVNRGPIAAVAAFGRNGPALSVLVTLGAPAEHPPNISGARGVLHQISRATDNYAGEALTVLRYFIGGLSVAGKLSGYGSWNSGSDIGRPLNALNSYASSDEEDADDVLEIHSLMYEQGARCASGTAGECGVPAEEVLGTAGLGLAFTITARAHSGIQGGLAGSAVSASLSANGWAISLNAGAHPDEAEVSRTRAPLETDAAAMFTLTLTSAAGADSRYVRASVGLGEDFAEVLISAAKAGDAAEVRRALGELTPPYDEYDGGVPLLITTAILGRAEVVSILITAGFSPTVALASAGSRNVPLLMASHTDTAQPDGSGELPRAKRLEVMRSFGDAVAEVGAVFDWNERPSFHMSWLFHLSEQASSSDAGLILEMADYALTRGMHCGHVSHIGRYRKHCVGSLGKALADAVESAGETGGTGPIVAAAEAMIAAGVPLSVAGNPDWSDNGGVILGRAADNFNGPAVSVLVTLGADLGIPFSARGVPHEAALGSGSNLAKGLPLLRHFIGGLEVAGKLSSYDSWNAVSDVGSVAALNGTPLQIMSGVGLQTNAPGLLAMLDEMHALFYEQGARCPSGSGRFCGVPTEDASASDVSGTGSVLTITSRAHSGFASGVAGASVLASLGGSGWTLTIAAGTLPEEAVLSRVRGQELGDGDAIFTLTLTSAAGAASRFVRVSAELEEDSGLALVAAVRGGNAGEVVSALGGLTPPYDENDGSVPMLITAAVLGHAEVVSVLITAGFDADARSPFGGFNLNIPLLMATYDGTQQPDGSGELSRASRANVLRHFGDGLAVRGTLYHNWNLIDGNNNHFTNLLGFSENNEPPESDPILQEMADYALTRGMHCGHISATDPDNKYGKYCVGTSGAALAKAVNGIGADTPAETIRAMAVSLIATGVPLHVVGATMVNPGLNELAVLAAWKRNGPVVSVLVSLGAAVEVPAGVRGVHHQVARASHSNNNRDPGEMLAVLQHFIGGLEASGRLSGYGSWSVAGYLNETALDLMTMYASTDAQYREVVREMHSLLYEQGSRCASETTGYCAIPEEDVFAEAEFAGTGEVLTLTARTYSGFQSPLVGSAVESSLFLNGWRLSLDSAASPDEAVLLRLRESSLDLPADFAVTLTGFAGGESRVMNVRATAAAFVGEDFYATLLAAVEEGDAERTREALGELGVDGGVDLADRSGEALVIVAATLGHAEVVSVLITFGYAPEAESGGRNVARLMADASPATLDYGQRLDVLRHFGDAMDVRGTMLADWQSGQPMNSLRDAYDGAAAGDKDAMLLMADYYLARGASCVGGLYYRYRPPCVGSFGITLKDYANQTGGSPPNDDVRIAAQAAVDAGIPTDILGVNGAGELVGLAAHRNNAGIVSILITFGFDPSGRGGTGGRVDWTALHHAAVEAENDAPKGLNLLRHFIGGLHDSGGLTLFSDWNPDSNQGRPLDIVRTGAIVNADNLEAKGEMHSLLYEQGARCAAAANATLAYCRIPREDYFAGEAFSGTGAVLTMTARMFAGFASPAVASGVEASLTANGWGLELNASAEPDELVLSRLRVLSLDLPAEFGVTLVNASGEAARVLDVRATAAAPAGPDYVATLVVAVLNGDADAARFAVGELGEATVDLATPEGEPLLLTAAVLGHADIVSILITAGYNPATHRGAAFFDLNIPLLMATHDGTEQPGGGELARDKRWEVLRHFGDAVEVRGTVFNGWNDKASNGDYYAAELLGFSLGAEGSSSASVLQEMADYMLSKGMRCGFSPNNVYRDYCIGSSGIALVSVVMDSGAGADDVRAAAQGMVDAGLSVDVAGDAGLSVKVGGLAILGYNGAALSVLLTFGADADSRGENDRGAPHYAGEGAGTSAPDALAMLQGFIGGLSASGRTSEFAGWNLTISGETPLDALHNNATISADHPDEKGELHALLYERGSRCSAPGGKRYCRLPFESRVSPEALSAGGALTMTARGVADEAFASPLLDAEKTAEISAAGWELRLEAGASPDEVVLSRGSGGPDLGVAFTISLLSGGGEAIREYQVGVRPLLEYAAEPGGTLRADVASGRRVDSGRAITITAEVASVGFDFAGWSGDGSHCAAEVLECVVTVVSDVTVGASFARDCAGENREDDNSANNLCGDCFDGFGDDGGGMCVMPRVTYAAGEGGTLSADVESGRRVDFGATITIAAMASVGFVLLEWQGDGDHCAAGDSECVVTVVSDVSVGASFARDCAGEAVLNAATNECECNSPNEGTGADCKAPSAEVCGALTPAEFYDETMMMCVDIPDCNAVNRALAGETNVCGDCLEGFGEDDSGMCIMPRVTYEGVLDGGAVGGGTISSDVASGESVAFGASVTLTATPAEGYFIYEWQGENVNCGGGDAETTGAAGRLICVVAASAVVDVRVLFRLAVRDCSGENRMDGAASHLCGVCVAGYEEMEGGCVALPDRDCMAENRVDGAASYLCGDCLGGHSEIGGLCFSNDGGFGRLPQREVCTALGGSFRENEAVCTGVDESGTFCILNSVEVFPCGGLFRRVLRCNLMYQRPAVNPFVCGGVCSSGAAVGGGCRN